MQSNRYSKRGCDPAMAAFQEVATILALYKIALYLWESGKRDETIAAEEKERRRCDVELAAFDLSELIDRMDDLTPTCRQQIILLYRECVVQQINEGLSKENFSGYEFKEFGNGDPDSDSDGESELFVFGGDEEEGSIPLALDSK
ncbi:hypothetical protein NMY22_g2206 [Coprinellus aureogranulatus]|nr:hypothetical protein NMY22_g2206 [Coprinellus aureogranulatus]